MNRFLCALIGLLCSLLSFAQVDVLLSPEQLAQVGKKRMTLLPRVAPLSEETILLADKSQLYALSEASFYALSKSSSRQISDFAVVGDFIMAIVDKKLCALNEQYNWETIASLPAAKMQMAPGYSSVYFYDTVPVKKKYNLYVYNMKNLKMAKLIASPEPITAVVETGTTVLFSTPGSIYGVDGIQGKVAELINLKDAGQIVSMCMNSRQDILYVSTTQGLYKVEKGRTVRLSKEASGPVCMDGKGLVVARPEKSVIYRLHNELLDK